MQLVVWHVLKLCKYISYFYIIFHDFQHFSPVVVDDDVAVIDIMNRNEGDFGAQRPLTGSAAKEDAVEDYSLDSKFAHFI